MDESWDAENFEPKLPTTLTSSNKWEGEDEEEEVKESWEDEEEEKKDEEKKEVPLQVVKPKKKIQEKIAEREAREAERHSAEKEEALTPEQRLAQKLLQQKLQEESDLRLAMETFGVTEGNAGRLDTFHPTNKDEFNEFAELLTKKINIYRMKEEFPAFAETLIKNIVVQMSSLDIKRIKLTVDNLYIEKQKAEKNDKSKKPTKGKAKAKLRIEGDNAALQDYGTFGDEYDDFM